MALTDRNAILSAFNSVSYNTEDATLLQYPTDVLFYQYLDETSCAYTDYKGFIYDGVLAKAQFKILKGAKLKNTTLVIQAFNSVLNASFPLESFNLDFSSKYSTDFEIPAAINTPRGFKLLPADPRNNILFSRNLGIDTLTYFGYNLDYGFKLRWEAWRQLTQFNNAFQLNHTQNWSTYSLRPGWEIQLVLINFVEKDGLTTEFNRICNIKAQNRLFSDDGFGGTISSTLETFLPIIAGYVSSSGFIARDRTTHVLVTLTGNFAALPTGYTDYYGILSIDVENTGGIQSINQTNSDQNPLSTSIWLNKAILTKVNATTITIEADIDQNKLNTQVNRYLLSCRFGFQGCTPGDSGFLLWTTGGFFVNGDGSKIKYS